METRQLYVGFADLDHFARFAEAHSLQEVHALLQEAFTAAGDEIVTRGGRIVKYLGDSVLFTFDDPKTAAEAARAIAGGYRRPEGDLELRFRVSVATGEVLCAELGHPSLVCEDVLGLTVNEAAKGLKAAGAAEDGVALCPQTQA